MNTSEQGIRTEGAKDALVDIASIVAVVLIGLVVLVLTHPRFGTDLGTVWLDHGTHSNQVVAHESAGS
jgi:hypothetical protein